VVFTSAKRRVRTNIGEYGAPDLEADVEDGAAKPKRIYDSAKFMGETSAPITTQMGIETVSLPSPRLTGRQDCAARSDGSDEPDRREPGAGLPFKLEKGGTTRDDFVYNKDSALGIYLADRHRQAEQPGLQHWNGVGVSGATSSARSGSTFQCANGDRRGLNFYGSLIGDRRLRHLSRAAEELGLQPEYRPGARHR